MSKEKEIRIKGIEVVETTGGEIEILYIPDTTQVLRAGQRYKFVFELKEAADGRPTNVTHGT